MKRLLYIILLSILVSCASRRDSCVQYSDDTIFYKVVEIKSNDAWLWDVIYAKKEGSSMIDIIFSFKPERVDGFEHIMLAESLFYGRMLERFPLYPRDSGPLWKFSEGDTLCQIQEGRKYPFKLRSWRNTITWNYFWFFTLYDERILRTPPVCVWDTIDKSAGNSMGYYTALNARGLYLISDDGIDRILATMIPEPPDSIVAEIE